MNDIFPLYIFLIRLHNPIDVIAHKFRLKYSCTVQSIFIFRAAHWGWVCRVGEWVEEQRRLSALSPQQKKIPLTPPPMLFTMKTLFKCFMCSESAAGRVMSGVDVVMNGIKAHTWSVGRSWNGSKWDDELGYQRTRRRWVIDFSTSCSSSRSETAKHPQLQFTISRLCS